MDAIDNEVEIIANSKQHIMFGPWTFYVSPVEMEKIINEGMDYFTGFDIKSQGKHIMLPVSLLPEGMIVKLFPRRQISS